MNPFQMMQLLRQSKNPQQFILNMLEQQMGNTPMGENLINLAKNNQTAEIEQIARNIVGPDFDKQFSNFKNQMGIK